MFSPDFSNDRRMSLGALVLANALPLVGVVVLGWNVFELVTVYWLETGVVGLLTLPKMLFAGGRDAGIADRLVRSFTGRQPDPPTDADGPTARPVGLAVGIPFVLVYGSLWLFSGVFVLSFKALTPSLSTGSVLAGTAPLAASQGVSLYTDFFRGGEWRTAGPGEQFLAPFRRIGILYVAFVLGRVVSAALETAVVALAILVVVKTTLDVVDYLSRAVNEA